MIRMILEAIYEPEFELRDNNSNFGFRPKKSTHDAMKTIGRKSQGLRFALEGDIEGAYDNVKHKKLLSILRKKVTDNKFLKLIDKGLKSRIMDKGKYVNSLVGTPQGGIASPNIYLSELDLYRWRIRLDSY